MMKHLYSQQSVMVPIVTFRNGPESHSERPDPIDAVRSGIVGDLADLQNDVATNEDQESTFSKAITAVAQGPIVGPARLWQKMRNKDQDDNE